MIFLFFNKENCPAGYVRLNLRCDFKNNRKVFVLLYMHTSTQKYSAMDNLKDTERKKNKVFNLYIF